MHGCDTWRGGTWIISNFSSIESSEKASEPRAPAGSDVRKTTESEQHQALGMASPKHSGTQTGWSSCLFSQIPISSCWSGLIVSPFICLVLKVWDYREVGGKVWEQQFSRCGVWTSGNSRTQNTFTVRYHTIRMTFLMQHKDAICLFSPSWL